MRYDQIQRMVARSRKRKGKRHCKGVKTKGYALDRARQLELKEAV